MVARMRATLRRLRESRSSRLSRSYPAGGEASRQTAEAEIWCRVVGISMRRIGVSSRDLRVAQSSGAHRFHQQAGLIEPSAEGKTGHLSTRHDRPLPVRIEVSEFYPTLSPDCKSRRWSSARSRTATTVWSRDGSVMKKLSGSTAKTVGGWMPSGQLNSARDPRALAATSRTLLFVRGRRGAMGAGPVADRLASRSNPDSRNSPSRRNRTRGTRRSSSPSSRSFARRE